MFYVSFELQQIDTRYVKNLKMFFWLLVFTIFNGFKFLHGTD